jgi:hypothetical protein
MDAPAPVKWRLFHRTLKIHFDGGKIPLPAELSPANMDSEIVWQLRLRIESKPAVFNKNGNGMRMPKTCSIAVPTGNR